MSSDVNESDGDRLREDIRELRWLIDAALDRRADRILLEACAEVLREKSTRLAEFERFQSSRTGVDTLD